MRNLLSKLGIHPARLTAIISAAVVALSDQINRYVDSAFKVKELINVDGGTQIALTVAALVLGETGAKSRQVPKRAEKKAAKREAAWQAERQAAEHLRQAEEIALQDEAERQADIEVRKQAIIEARQATPVAPADNAAQELDEFDAWTSTLPLAVVPADESTTEIPLIEGGWAPYPVGVTEDADGRFLTLPFRNNNPGAIIRKPGQRGAWKGLSDPANDGPFCRFLHPKWGIRALVRICRNYRKRGIRTFRQHCHEWAPLPPPGMEEERLYKGNDPDAYAEFISAQLGLEPDDVIPLDTVEERAALAKAIGLREGGQQVREWPDEFWVEGSKLESA